MAKPVIMPKTGMAMEEGTILEWNISEGDSVSEGDVIGQIETDKSTMELECDATGTVLKILYEAGSVVPVTKPLLWIGEKGEAIPEDSENEIDRTASAPEVKPQKESEVPSPALEEISNEKQGLRATPAARSEAKEKNIELTQVRPSGRYGEIRLRDVRSLTDVKITPLAGKIASERGISPHTIQGRGVGGKIFSGDIPKTPASFSRKENPSDQEVPLTKIQQITGKRMLQSTTEIPSVSMTIQVNADPLLNLIKQIRNEIQTSENDSENHEKITVNDFIVATTALSLRKHPRVNSVFNGTTLSYKGEINIGIATATPRGLLVPVLKNADHYSLRQISSQAKQLITQSREGTLRLESMQEGTFTISNLGKFGIESFQPIINPPQAAILGVCTIKELPAIRENNLVNVKVMNLVLSFDHRILDGAEAALFLQELKTLLENPLRVLLA